ncbi:DHS-like NAD/FAD-binding domain-containing protein [Phlyctochytrium arcticum]|nr:DHS-like NAD/FAD-binding domain-containing protein [Phlyctochytrium arcticum]
MEVNNGGADRPSKRARMEEEVSEKKEPEQLKELELGSNVVPRVHIEQSYSPAGGEGTVEGSVSANTTTMITTSRTEDGDGVKPRTVEHDVVTADLELVGHSTDSKNGSTHTLPVIVRQTNESEEGTSGKEGIPKLSAAGHGQQTHESEGEPSEVVFTLTEKTKDIMQNEARHLGFWDFMEKYGSLPMPFLFEVFDFTLPIELSKASDDDLLPLLKNVMMKKVAKRQKRLDINTLEQVVELLQTCQNIVVLTGAGVSVSCGIPDFRSKNGIYTRLDEFDLDDPQQMFDIEYFKIQPQTFYSFAREIYPSNFKPSPSHRFIKLLEQKGKLLRNYTQNIDTLEQVAGIEKVVQCHGSFAAAKCIVCGYRVPGDALRDDIFAQRVPMCPHCPEEVEGIMKPDITFFGEMLPDEFDRLFALDRQKVDLLIVMGSSLKVSPVADVKDKIPHDVPQILINLESLPHMAGFDVHLLGYCDAICKKLCELLGWDLECGTDTSTPTTSAMDQSSEPNTGEKENLSEAESLAPEAEDQLGHRQGYLPHHYLFEGAIGSSEMDPNAYIPSDREDDSGTSDSTNGDSGSDSGSEKGSADGEDPTKQWDGQGQDESTTLSIRAFPNPVSDNASIETETEGPPEAELPPSST